MPVKARDRAARYVWRMENALPWFRPLSIARWRELVWPKEHGSWSLAGEPLALALVAAPTTAGCSSAGSGSAATNLISDSSEAREESRLRC